MNLPEKHQVVRSCSQAVHGLSAGRSLGVPSFKSQEIMVLGDWAWMRNRLRVTITPPGGQPAVRSGYTLTILRKEADGRWVIARDANLLTAEVKG